MYCRSYPLLDQAYKVIPTLSVTQVGCERTFSKMRYYKTLHVIGDVAFERKRVYNFTNNKRVYKRFYNFPPSPIIFKLRYVKYRLRKQLSEERSDSLLLMCVERDVLLRISNHIIDQRAKMNAEMQRLLLYK